MDIVNWIVVIGMMNILVGLVWVLQTSSKKNSETAKSKSAD